MPVTAFSYNVAAVTAPQTPGAKCILGSNPAYLSSELIKLAVDILDGKKPKKPALALLYTPYLTTNPTKITGYGYSTQEKIVLARLHSVARPGPHAAGDPGVGEDHAARGGRQVAGAASVVSRRPSGRRIRRRGAVILARVERRAGDRRPNASRPRTAGYDATARGRRRQGSAHRGRLGGRRHSRGGFCALRR